MDWARVRLGLLCTGHIGGVAGDGGDGYLMSAANASGLRVREKEAVHVPLGTLLHRLGIVSPR